MFPLTVVEVVSLADIAGATPPAVVGVASPAVIVEVMLSTDHMDLVDPLGKFGVKYENDCLACDSCIEYCDDTGECQCFTGR